MPSWRTLPLKHHDHWRHLTYDYRCDHTKSGCEDQIRFFYDCDEGKESEAYGFSSPIFDAALMWYEFPLIYASKSVTIMEDNIAIAEACLSEVQDSAISSSSNIEAEDVDYVETSESDDYEESGDDQEDGVADDHSSAAYKNYNGSDRLFGDDHVADDLEAVLRYCRKTRARIQESLDYLQTAAEADPGIVFDEQRRCWVLVEQSSSSDDVT